MQTLNFCKTITLPAQTVNAHIRELSTSKELFLTLRLKKLAAPTATVNNTGAQIVHVVYWSEYIFAAGMYELQIE